MPNKNKDKDIKNIIEKLSNGIDTQNDNSYEDFEKSQNKKFEKLEKELNKKFQEFDAAEFEEMSKEFDSVIETFGKMVKDSKKENNKK